MELHGEGGGAGKPSGDEAGTKVERADGYEPPVQESVWNWKWMENKSSNIQSYCLVACIAARPSWHWVCARDFHQVKPIALI